MGEYNLSKKDEGRYVQRKDKRYKQKSFGQA
jgi:hypothetical protein